MDQSRDNKVRVGLHGKNLNDTRYKVAGGYYFPTLGEGSVTAFYGAQEQSPRDFGLPFLIAEESSKQLTM